MKKLFLVISIISVLFLAGCSKNVVENDNNQVQEEQSNNQNTDININKNDNEEILETTYSGEGNIIFEDETFLIVGASAPEDAWYTPDYQIVTLDSLENGKFVIKYSWNSDVHYYINGNIVSLLVIAPWENGVDCYVYNIDTLNKKEITDKELIELTKSDYSKCIEKVKETTLNMICSEEEYKEIKILAESEKEASNFDNWYENAMSTMTEKYNIPASPASIVSAYEYELQNDSSIGTKFYLNENGDICFVRKYIDNVGSQKNGEYMYNLTQDKVIDEFDVYCG